MHHFFATSSIFILPHPPFPFLPLGFFRAEEIVFAVSERLRIPCHLRELLFLKYHSTMCCDVVLPKML